MKEFFKKLWEKIKAWAKLTALPWLKKSWMQIVNILVIFIAYSALYDYAQWTLATGIIGIWLLILLAYYIFWKLLGIEKWFIKKEEPKPVAKKPVKKTAKKK